MRKALLSSCVAVGMLSAVALGEPVVTLSQAIESIDKPTASWRLGSVDASATSETELGSFGKLNADVSLWRVDAGKVIAAPAKPGQHAAAVYTVPAGAGGFYRLGDTVLQRRDELGRSELRVFVRHADAAREPAVYTFIDAGESFDFDTFLGYLDAGDEIWVTLGADGDGKPDASEIDFAVERTPSIPVGAFEKGSTEFRAPHSGYYALHDASGAGEAKVTVGNALRGVMPLKSNTGADLGYISKGEVIRVAGTTDFAANVVEWAPRRAPLRVERGNDGYLDVRPSNAPDKLVDIVKANWVEVPAAAGDQTDAIRAAFAKAKTLAGNGWAGVRLTAGATYVIGSSMDGGNIFDFSNIERVVLDGNGATLTITNPEIQRKGYNLFTTGRGTRNLAFADLTVTASHVPFTLGRITDVNPKTGNSQTVTVKLEPGAVDPIKEIARDGRANAYAYDPLIPGRLGFGTWSHYPGAGEGAQVKPTGEPGVFTHSLTRTGSSLNVGDKWLIKNKGGGLVYLVTRTGAQDITLSNVDGRASGGGTLRFWATSGVNILNCRFEPDGDNWISSSADGLHGRGREGVWVEDTILRGICEDIMNTYGRTMAVKPDDNAGDTSIALGVYENSVRSGRTPLRNVDEDDVRVGDRLVFFSPASGKVLGYANVKSRDGERVTLDKPVASVVPWNGSNPREFTMVYSADSVGRFVVRDSKFMDSMRIGIYIKAQGGVIWGNTLEGLASPGVYGANEPEWPEGPPPTHLWVQGNTFSQNNYGYTARHRDFITVDPADILIYTRKFRDPSQPDDHNAFIARGQHANSHVKLIGNTFHDWRGMGISVRNAKNVTIQDNLFLPPVQDDLMRKTLGEDPSMSSGGKGVYAAIHLDSVDGARMNGNRFVGLPSGDRSIVQEQQVMNVVAADNETATIDKAADASLSFSNWVGPIDNVTLNGATHAAGRLGGGLFFDGKDARATLSKSAGIGKALDRFTLALWIRPERDGGQTQVIYSHGDATHGVLIALDRGRVVGKLWQSGKAATVDLGASVPALWRHVALVFDGKSLRGSIDGVEAASVTDGVPARLEAIDADATFGGGDAPLPLAGAYRGTLDEFQFFSRAISADEIACIALRRPGMKP